MSVKIVVFTLIGCSHCTNLKSKLKDENIPYTEIEITNNQEIWDNVVEQTGHDALPTIFIDIPDEDVGPAFIAGVDFDNPEDIIPKIKNYLQ